MIEELLCSQLIAPDEWESLPAELRDELCQCADQKMLLAKLVQHELLTEYQAGRIGNGKTFGLILGNYRVLDRMGGGGMGILFKAKHIHLHRLAAIKVLPWSILGEHSPAELQRFRSEVKAIGKLFHPNIVHALDAGHIASPDPDMPAIHYYAMEYVEGRDLEALVEYDGRLSVKQACDFACQIASALQEAHRHNLVHRDIKPANIMVTPEGQAKLLDFGLVRHFNCRMTEPGALLGTVEYMAPEQAQDASAVDIRADIFGLGGVLFWCLTGRTPFIKGVHVAETIAQRQTSTAPSIRTFRPEVPAELDAIVARMMACKPEDRYPTPQAVLNALWPFVKAEVKGGNGEQSAVDGGPKPIASLLLSSSDIGCRLSPDRVGRILIADDESDIRTMCCKALTAAGFTCDEAEDGAKAYALLSSGQYDLLVTDWNMPGLTGPELCKRLRENLPVPHLKVLLFSAQVDDDELAQVLNAGADDCLTKPFSLGQLVARARSLIRLKDAQDRSDLLNRRLLAVNHQLEQNLTARDSDLVHTRNAIVLAMAKMVAYRDVEPRMHLVRVQRYSRRLAEAASELRPFSQQIDGNFVQMLECCAPLHDIGKVGLPDHILLKPGKYEHDERLLMQTHTTIGSDILCEVAREHGAAVAFLQMAIDITRHHHERFDGKGYPDRLAGSDIPLAARIVAIADVYDALRSRRSYKPALSHAAAWHVMLECSSGQFDPVLLQALQHCESDFECIARKLPD